MEIAKSRKTKFKKLMDEKGLDTEDRQRESNILVIVLSKEVQRK